MPKSRNRPNHHRRIQKRKADQALKRDIARSLQELVTIRTENVRMRMILFAVLGQIGGEVTVTEGTLRQIGDRLSAFDYAIEDGQVKGESIVKLLERQDDADADGQDTDAHVTDQRDDSEEGNRGTPAYTITRIDESEAGEPAEAPGEAGDRRDVAV